MCPKDDSYLTLEFTDQYVFCPTIIFFGQNIDYTNNRLGEVGQSVQQGYEYHSGNNPDFLDVQQNRDFDH